MADDWEDWEEQEIKLPAKPVDAAKPINPLLADLDLSKFADEDADIDKEEKKHVVPGSQPKKKEEKKYLKEQSPVDEPLDDPVAEKARRQRLVEQADLAAAQELFDGVSKVNLDAMLPKTVKDFDDYATALVGRYVTIHKDSKNYKAFLKALIKAAVGPLTSQDTKEIEQSIGATRADKHKAEQAEAAAKKNTKKTINLGKGGDMSAGLDDYIYDDAGNGDDFDFM